MSASVDATSRIVFVRHGQTDYNSGGRVQGQIDIALNETGRQQASAMGPVVAKFEPVKIVSSDLSRAHDTAREIARHTDAEIVLDERVRERAFGVFEGLNRDELLERYPQWYRQWRDTGECTVAGVEARAAVGERLVAAVREFVAREPGTYVFVSHGSAITQAMVNLMGLSPSEWMGLRGPDNCHWSIMDQSSRTPSWKIIAHNVGVLL
ncbi:MAG: histidine phosphatase family protein [Actinomycetaceae bacterium]|nr:histidine phosphatase family protein [Actinomycetaceae bacterium]